MRQRSYQVQLNKSLGASLRLVPARPRRRARQAALGELVSNYPTALIALYPAVPLPCRNTQAKA